MIVAALPVEQETRDCAHCYDAKVAENGLYCQPCADEIGEAYMQELMAEQEVAS